MQGPEMYDLDDKLMDELGGAMDEYDHKQMHPVVSITIAASHGDGCECPDCKAGEAGKGDGDEAMPTPEEMDELQKVLG